MPVKRCADVRIINYELSIINYELDGAEKDVRMKRCAGVTTTRGSAYVCADEKMC